MSGERQGAACPDHGATARNDGVCMVRGCRYGTARLVNTDPDCGCHPDDCPGREGVKRQGAERDAPPVTKYELTLVIHGNSHDEIERELLVMTRGGYLLDSDYYKRDSFRVIGGRKTSTLEHTNPAMTPERYEEDLHAWAERRRQEPRPIPTDPASDPGAET